MRETTKNRILCLLFGGFLLVMGALFLFAPKESFSPLEKRYLAEAPRAELSEILSGRFGRQAEDWAADQLPGFFLDRQVLAGGGIHGQKGLENRDRVLLIKGNHLSALRTFF